MRILCPLLATLASMFGGGTAAAEPQLAVSLIRDDGAFSGLGLVAPDGGDRTTLSSRRGWTDDHPSFSPDGKRIAFTRTKDGYRSFHIYVMRADGSRVRQITRGRFDERPAWSPDGKWIAYQSMNGVLRITRPDGSGDRVVKQAAGAYDPAWTPSGRLTYVIGKTIVMSRVDGSGRRRLVRGRQPAFSPDGKRLAFTGTDGGVFVAQPDGDGARMISRGLDPAWSPDGKRIAYTRWPKDGGFNDTVWTMDPDGGNARRVLKPARSPAWRP